MEHGYFEGALESGLRAAASVCCSVDDNFALEFQCLNKLGEMGEISTTEHSVEESVSSDCITNNLPVTVKRVDHYTLICPNAETIAANHSSLLGFDLECIKRINSGTAAPGEVDMLNYIMHPPANKDLVMVVTEGLNDETVFRKYMSRFGQGVHHLAFEVESAEEAFRAVKNAGVTTCSDKVTIDVISGLKQFFIPPEFCGFFIELIERPQRKCLNTSTSNKPNLEQDASRPSFFKAESMADLALSVSKYLGADEDSVDSEDELGGGGVMSLTDTSDKVGSVGEIAAIQISVECVQSSADFLVKMFDFRLLRQTANRVYLYLTGSNITLILRQAEAKSEERQASVIFNAAQNRMDDDDFDDLRGAKLSRDIFSYDVFLAQPHQLSQLQKVVRTDDLNLSVHIRSDLSNLADFVSCPMNLAQWTGHRAIRFSKRDNCWLEVRSSTKCR